MPVSVMIVGDDPALMRRVVGHVAAFAGELAPADGLEYACFTFHDFGTPFAHIERAEIIGLNRIGGLFSDDSGGFDHHRYKPWQSFWYTLQRLLPFWFYQVLRAGFNARNMSYKKYREASGHPKVSVVKLRDDDGWTEADPRAAMNQVRFDDDEI